MLSLKSFSAFSAYFVLTASLLFYRTYYVNEPLVAQVSFVILILLAIFIGFRRKTTQNLSSIDLWGNSFNYINFNFFRSVIWNLSSGSSHANSEYAL